MKGNSAKRRQRALTPNGAFEASGCFSELLDFAGRSGSGRLVLFRWRSFARTR